MNLLKILILAAVPVAALGVAAYLEVDETIVLFGFMVFLVLAIGFYWFSDRIVLKLCGAELLTVYHSPTIFKAVEELSSQAGVPMPKIYMIPADAPNVCSVGRNMRNAGLLLTEGVMKKLNHGELYCAIAHEMVHIYRRDSQIGALAAVFASFLGMSTSAAMENASDGRQNGRFVFRGISAFTAPVASILIQSLVDTKREFQADEFGARLTGRPLDMANTIRTMEKRKHVTPMGVYPSVAHLFMVNPMRPGRIERMFSTHPSMVQRIERLEALHKEMSKNKHVYLLN